MTEDSLPEQIARRLRRDILRGTLPPGAAIKERDSAAEMGVSRTPTREAIRILAKEGLVELRPARSPIVARLDVKTCTDQAEVLIALEQLSGELACHHATEAELDGLAAILRQMQAQFATADPLDLFELDMAFHMAIAEASHNAALADTHRTYLQRLWHPRYLAAAQRRARERVVREHTEIIAALRSRAPEQARQAIGTHLQYLATDIRALILSQGGAPAPSTNED